MAEFALTQPQACYTAYTFGLKRRWTYFLRTLPDIHDVLEPLENAISQVLIPAITEHKCKQLDRDVLALPVRMGGLCFGNPLNKREFRDAIKLRYDWPIDDIPSTCVCVEAFTIDHAMIYKRGGFVIQREILAES